MLLICVIAAVIGFLAYTVIKARIEEWLEENNMKRAASSSSSSTDGLNIIDITDDSDDMSINTVEGNTEAKPNVSGAVATMAPDLSDSVKAERSIDENEEFQKPTIQRVPLFNWGDMMKNDGIKGRARPKHAPKKIRRKPEQAKLEFVQPTEVDEVVEEPVTKTNAAPEVQVQFRNPIAGVNVCFPAKPYSCQLALMHKLICGCLKAENCLLESPTGSGKTLALLSGALAWQEHHIAKAQKEVSVAMFDESDEFTKENKDCNIAQDASSDVEQQKMKSIPKIFYCTRTHKQLEQIVRELRKSCYSNKRMTILSSREHSCIHDTSRNKTELCNELLDPATPSTCPFYTENNKKTLSSFPAVERHGLGRVWDIEDLVSIGKRTNVCAYFAARALMDQAEIIFCPYNYVIDPDIRESVQIDLTGNVVIFDEGHNLEDGCREVASVILSDNFLSAACTECVTLEQINVGDSRTYNILHTYIAQLVKFITQTLIRNIHSTSEAKSSNYWDGRELLELLDIHGLGSCAYAEFEAAAMYAIAEANRAKDENRQNPKEATTTKVISTSTKSVIDRILYTMRMISNEKYADDFRACIIEDTVGNIKHALDDRWYSITQPLNSQTRLLKLICMNPGVIFAPLADACRTVIVASGTLSPIDSFLTELGTVFNHTLTAGHVIPSDQIFATCVASGPSGINLKANFNGIKTWSFQDELGLVLVDVCESVPHGILCFFSSYNAMYLQINRWKTNGTWKNIAKVKDIFTEPRSGGDLANIIGGYREVIHQTSIKPRGTVNGALFLAVFRGKVAEGIDFKDDEARCVVVIGIPYAVRIDPVIDMKVSYNNKHNAEGRLSGSIWYSTLAFRALNQALGRCLRHIEDWGALLLVDSRFLMKQNVQYLPKWVKDVWKPPTKDYNVRQQLRRFVETQKAREASARMK